MRFIWFFFWLREGVGRGVVGFSSFIWLLKDKLGLFFLGWLVGFVSFLVGEFLMKELS